MQKYPGAETIPGIVIVRLDAPLFFANTTHFENSIADHLAAGQELANEAGLVSGVRFLVLDLSPVTRSDSSGAHMLLDLAKELQEKGVQLVLANPTDQVKHCCCCCCYFLAVPTWWLCTDRMLVGRLAHDYPCVTQLQQPEKDDIFAAAF